MPHYDKTHTYTWKEKDRDRGRYFLWILSHRIHFQVSNLEEKHVSLFFLLKNQNKFKNLIKLQVLFTWFFFNILDFRNISKVVCSLYTHTYLMCAHTRKCLSFQWLSVNLSAFIPKFFKESQHLIFFPITYIQDSTNSEVLGLYVKKYF